jgi:hypothetical protein
VVIVAQYWRAAVLVLAIVAGQNSADPGESLFLADRTAYNPIPSPDGSKVAFVETGRARRGGSGGLGRSNLQSDVRIADKDGKLLGEKVLADAFLAGWTTDGERLVCFRDWRFFLVAADGTKFQAGLIPEQESRPERVVYNPTTRRFLWVERDFGLGVVRTDAGEELARHEHTLYPPNFALSNDGKWLAAVSEKELVVLNIASMKWTNLGPVTIHPYGEWDYIKPSWDPWFKDSTRLTFVSEGKVVVATPDGKSKRTLCELRSPGGLATASPDGKRVAYVTFVERPRKSRPDLKFWGDARVWTVSVEQPDRAIAVTGENPSSISTIRWLNNDAVIFDRLGDAFPFRLWRADVAPKDK